MTNQLMTTIGGVRFRLEDARTKGYVDKSNRLTDAGKALDKAHKTREDRRNRRTTGKARSVANKSAVGQAQDKAQQSSQDGQEGDPGSQGKSGS